MECGQFNERNYLKFLQALADRYFVGVYCASSGNQPAPTAFDNVLLHDGKLKLELTEDDREKGKLKFDKKGIMDISVSLNCKTEPMISFAS